MAGGRLPLAALALPLLLAAAPPVDALLAQFCEWATHANDAFFDSTAFIQLGASKGKRTLPGESAAQANATQTTFVDEDAVQAKPSGSAAAASGEGGGAAGAQGNASKVLPGARVWLTPRALDQIGKDVFPVMLPRMLETHTLQPYSGSYGGFDWSLTDLKLANLNLNPPVLRIYGRAGLFFGVAGAFEVQGKYSIKGRSLYSFAGCEGNFTMPLGPGSRVGGIVYLGISPTGKPSLSLGPMALRMEAGDLQTEGFFSRKILEFGAKEALSEDLSRHMRSAFTAFVQTDLNEVLSEQDTFLPIRLPEPYNVLSFDLSILKFALNRQFLVFDLFARPIDRMHPSLSYPAPPVELPTAPPKGFLSSMLTVGTTSWAADGALWLLGHGRSPVMPVDRFKLNSLLAAEMAHSFSARKHPSVLQTAGNRSALGLALFGESGVTGAVGVQPGPQIPPRAAAASTDFHWDLTPFLAARYGRVAAAKYTALAAKFAPSN